ncbi:phosphoglucomutase [Desulforhopalus vacuolatus]|uniref:phosphoglucomutase n=1 Tax=Desulforhopalus vacuolatus TaxID=40414 RepID=UPI001963AE11|nr:phosphoglucomutase [Desulforhopalus vacuolatus]MBM9519066.1 phosphoglucomutase [Desulforhopalus vacuolatus]
MLIDHFTVHENHADNDYFGMIRTLLAGDDPQRARLLSEVYDLLLDEIKTNTSAPRTPVKFGTSGWRGLLGRDLTVKSVTQVTRAVIRLYSEMDNFPNLPALLGVASLAEARRHGCVIGHDSRFGGEVLAIQAARELAEAGFAVYYAGETTTGVLSAVVEQQKLSFSINLTPSHNPLDYGGFKYNAADAGAAATELTEKLTAYAREIVESELQEPAPELWSITRLLAHDSVQVIDSFASWLQEVEKGESKHHLDLYEITRAARNNPDLFLAVDSVHGASRQHIKRLYGAEGGDTAPSFAHLRAEANVTFGGVAPEPSMINLKAVNELLMSRPEKLKIGAIIDPDGDRIRFSDGETEITMNHFGAMAYYFLHEKKGLHGLVAKTVATSNLANGIAAGLGEKVYEPAVGFKNFKPVIGEALVYFEESDGISILGHTAEKDAYIGLLLALAMVQSSGKNLGGYLRDIESEYGQYLPTKGGLDVLVMGPELQNKLARLDKYGVGSEIQVGGIPRRVKDVITLDGHKFVFEDGSWLMIRPSGTEPKVRFYVESRTSEGTAELMDAATDLLREAGLVE